MRLKTANLSFLSFLLLMSCSSPKLKDRSPAGLSGASKFNLQQLITALKQGASKGVSSHQECAQTARSFYQNFYLMNEEQSDMKNLSGGEIHDLVKSTFEAKLLMREKLGDLDLSKPGAPECYHSLRSLFRAMRYAEDYLIEIDGATRSADDYVTLQGDAPYFNVNAKFNFKDYNDLQSGDIILSRGSAYTSAAIARIGEDDAQFSHLTFVYKDKEGKLWTSEAHIEIGSVVHPLQTHIDQKNSRTVVFRYGDPKLAHQASEYIFNLVKKNSDKGKNIPYDFGMDYKDSKELFCSEVVYKGFKDVGKLDIPLYKTKFNAGLLPFLQQLGIKVDEKNIASFDTFAPGDIEMDHRFTMVAEWRNPAKMKQSRIKDAVLTKIFEWMEKDHYKFHPGLAISAKARVAWIMRRMPFLKKKLLDKFPTNMKTQQLKLFMVLDKIGSAIEDELALAEKKHGDRPLSPKELFEELEKIKEKDAALYRVKKKKALFHRSFHP